ncbi:MAG: helicase C-terminal domain-containing protein, partial [Thermofilaceae archaeon]
QVVIVNHSLLPFLNSLIIIPENSILIIDEAHLLPLEKETTIKVSEKDLIHPEEPKLEAFSSLREFNMALEEYLDKISLLKSLEKNGISSPGVYKINKPIDYDFSPFSEVLFFSATAPDKLPVSLDEVDELRLSDNRSWSNVSIIVENINYKMKNYNQTLISCIKEKSQTYDKIIVLATNSSQLELIEKEIGCPTTLNERPFSVVQKMLSGEAKIIAGTDIFWTGIDIPGKKCIIMTKLPFPVPEGKEKNEEQYVLAFSEMFKKFKQGIGRMLRTPQCGGEIIILDNRVKNYPDLMAYLQELEKKGAKVEVKQ